jgi:hypothetical protein
MDNKLQEEPSDWTESTPYQDTIATPPRLMRETTLGAPTRLKRQTTVAATSHFNQEESIATLLFQTPPKNPRDLEDQIRELRDQINIINEKLDRIILHIMK